MRDLAGLERKAGDHATAWAALRECRRTLDDVSNWPAVALGQMLVEELFLLAGSTGGGLADVVSAEADRQARKVGNVPLVLLQAAAVAATRCVTQTALSVTSGSAMRSNDASTSRWIRPRTGKPQMPRQQGFFSVR